MANSQTLKDTDLGTILLPIAHPTLVLGFMDQSMDLGNTHLLTMISTLETGGMENQME